MEPLDGDDVISFDELREKGRAGSDEDYKQPHRIGGGLGRRHLHLHVRHHRAAQGLHHRPPELARHARHGRGAERPRGGRGRLPVPAARARVRAADPARLDRRRRDDRLLGAGPAEDHPQPDGGEADLLPVACRACSRRSTRWRSRRRRTRRSSSRPSSSARRCARCSSAARQVPRRAAGGVRPGRPGAVPERPQPVRRAASSRPSPAPRRSRRRSSSSSTPAASWCSRAGA